MEKWGRNTANKRLAGNLECSVCKRSRANNNLICLWIPHRSWRSQGSFFVFAHSAWIFFNPFYQRNALSLANVNMNGARFICKNHLGPADSIHLCCWKYPVKPRIQPRCDIHWPQHGCQTFAFSYTLKVIRWSYCSVWDIILLHPYSNESKFLIPNEFLFLIVFLLPGFLHLPHLNHLYPHETRMLVSICDQRALLTRFNKKNKKNKKGGGRRRSKQSKSLCRKSAQSFILGGWCKRRAVLQVFYDLNHSWCEINWDGLFLIQVAISPPRCHKETTQIQTALFSPWCRIFM